MAVTGTPVTGSSSSITVTELITKILGDMAQPTDGTGFWSRTDVLQALDYVQREISRLTENIFATVTIEPATSATSLTIDANGNFLRGVSVYRTYGGSTQTISFYTENQVVRYDSQWRTRTGSRIQGLITGIMGEGLARPYPIPDNGDNDIIVNYMKIATRITTEGAIEIPQADIPCLEFGIKSFLYNLEKDGRDANKGKFWKDLYGMKDPTSGYLIGELSNVAARARAREEGTYSIIHERMATEEERLQPFYPWEV